MKEKSALYNNNSPHINIYSKRVIGYGLLWAVGIAIMALLLIHNNQPPNFDFYVYMSAIRYMDIAKFIAFEVIAAGILYEVYIRYKKQKQ